MIPLAALALAVEPAVIETYYQRTATLELGFEQTYAQGAQRRVESGTLVLRKPGRMRWAYSSGKLFVSDGRRVWFYEPQANRAEYSAVKESDDLRAPLAFLLGRLEFGKLFREVRREGAVLVAIPKSSQSPYREVRIEATAAGRIDRVEIRGQDASWMRFVFRDQRRNVPVDNRLFEFTPPPGTQIVDAGEP